MNKSVSQEDSICAIFRQNNIKGDCIGSGTFIIIKGMPFLITARHVIEGLDTSKGLIISSPKLEVFKLFFCQIYLHPKYDFAYIPLGKDFLEATKDKFFYFDKSFFNHIFGNFENDSMDLFTVYGHPYSQNKITKDLFKIKQFIYSTKNIYHKYEDYLSEKNYNSSEYRVLEFHKNNVSYNDDDEKVLIPKTESISGGGIYNNWNKSIITNEGKEILFRATSFHGTEDIKFSLDSIVIERIYNPDILIGLKFDLIYNYIKLKFDFCSEIIIDFEYHKINNIL